MGRTCSEEIATPNPLWRRILSTLGIQIAWRQNESMRTREFAKLASWTGLEEPGKQAELAPKGGSNARTGATGRVR